MMDWGTIFSIGSSLLSAGSKREQGKDAQRTAEENSALATEQASDALTRGSIEEQRYRRQLRQLIAKQRNAIGARNVEASGSALRLLEDSAQLGEEDALTIRNDAARQAWGYRNQANEAARIGRQSRLNADADATSTLLTGAAQAYGRWYDRNN